MCALQKNSAGRSRVPSVGCSTSMPCAIFLWSENNGLCSRNTQEAYNQGQSGGVSRTRVHTDVSPRPRGSHSRSSPGSLACCSWLLSWEFAAAQLDVPEGPAPPRSTLQPASRKEPQLAAGRRGSRSRCAGPLPSGRTSDCRLVLCQSEAPSWCPVGSWPWVLRGSCCFELKT